MTARDTFDRRLGKALLAYAADAAVDPDPVGFAAQIAAAHPRNRFAAFAGGLVRMQLHPLWLVIVLLLLAAVVGMALVGMRPLEPQPPGLVIGPPVPDQLYGRWVSDGSADRYLDLNSASLLHEADGRAVDWLGSVVGFLPASQGTIDGRVLIHSSLPCGDASYRLVPDETPLEGPTAAPAPSSSEQPRPSFFDRIRFADPVDPCPARQSFLANHPWTRLTVRLTAGGTFRSLDFGEPFQLMLPADAGLGLFDSSVGTMYQLVPGQVRISHPWWNGEFVDDVPVNRVPCRPDLGTLPDIPASVDEVEAWLNTATEVRFIKRTELVVDGRRALRWEISDLCRTETPAISELAAGYEFYAIPTGDDVILFVVRADTANESKVAERIVLALRFD